MIIFEYMLLVLCIGGGLFAEICPPDWHRYGESCYFIKTDIKMDWYQANRTCEDLGATLAVPTSRSEQDFIWEISKKSNPDEKSLWFGCYKEAGEWRNCPQKGNSMRAFENWDDNEPQPGSDCGLLWAAFDGKWGSYDCTSRTKYAICELHAVEKGDTQVFSLDTGKDGRLSTRCMVRHVMEELPGKSIVSCGKACRSHPRCRSFNLKQGGRRRDCELNGATRNEAETRGDMEVMENCYFFNLEDV